MGAKKKAISVIFFFLDIQIAPKLENPQPCTLVRLFSFDHKSYSFSFFLIVEQPNLIVLEYMANGALDKYLQVITCVL